jgi:hypothetical protein
MALLGAALFLIERRLPTTSATTPPAGGDVVVPASRFQARLEELERGTGRAPSVAARVALAAELADDEMLYREALARGLDRDDRSVRGRLAEKIRFLDATADAAAAPPADLAARAVALGLGRDDAFVRRVLVQKLRLILARENEAGDPGDAALARYLEAHADRWRQPSRLTLVQVYLRADDASAAEALREALAAGTRDPARSGDPFPAGSAVRDATPATVARLLGAAVAAAAAEAPLDTWVGPVRSPWGLHLLRVDARETPPSPALAAVRGQVLQAWRVEERAAREAQAIAALRTRWHVRVEGAGA